MTSAFLLGHGSHGVSLKMRHQSPEYKYVANLDPDGDLLLAVGAMPEEGVRFSLSPSLLLLIIEGQ